MKRRDFIRMSGYATVYLGVPFVAGCSHKPVNAAIDKPQFLMHIMDKKSLTNIGKQYIVKMPNEDSSSKLQTLLTEKAEISGSTPAEAVHEYFDQRSIADFKENNTVILDGWVISVTEARQCALFSIEEE